MTRSEAGLLVRRLIIGALVVLLVVGLIANAPAIGSAVGRAGAWTVDKLGDMVENVAANFGVDWNGDYDCPLNGEEVSVDNEAACKALQNNAHSDADSQTEEAAIVASPPADEAAPTPIEDEVTKNLSIPEGKVAIVTGRKVDGSINGDAVKGNKGFVLAIPAGANFTLTMKGAEFILVDADSAEAKFREELAEAGEDACYWHPESWS